MADHVTAYPLCWPAAFPRNRARRNATFKAQGGAEGPDAAIINVARDRALQEVRA